MSLYSIWLLEYATTPDCPIGALVQGKHNEGTVKLPFTYTLLKGQGTTILVDCGFNNQDHGKQLADTSGIMNWHAPKEVLSECGVRPEEIEHVIVTHAHYDHMGGMKFFPNAKFYLQEKELTQWVWAMALPSSFRWIMSATDPSDILHAAELARNGRLITATGDTEDVLPGIDLRLAADSHTAGSQYVVVRNDGSTNSHDTYVCAGDLVYRYENLHGGKPDDPTYIPIGFAMGSQTNLLMATHAILETVGQDYDRVLAAHEDRIFTTYPSRTTASGLRIAEVALASGQSSLVS